MYFSRIWKGILIIILGMSAVAILYHITMYSGREPVTSVLIREQGIMDLSEVDLDEEVVDISEGWVHYPSLLLSPGDSRKEDGYLPESVGKQAPAASYGSYHAVLYLHTDQYYSVCGWSVDYGMRMFVNDLCVLEVGKVADNEKEAVPRVNYYTVPIVSDEFGRAEIIIQYSNFVHREGGTLKPMYFATHSNLRRYQRTDEWMVFLLGGGLFVLAVFYFLDYCFFPRKEILFFSICCILFCLRNQRIFITWILPQDYQWAFNYRIMLSFMILEVLFLFLLEESMLLNEKHKWILCIYGVWSGICITALFFLPTVQAVGIMYLFFIGSIPFLVYFLLGPFYYFLKKKYKVREEVLPFLGFVVLLLSITFETYFYSKISVMTEKGLSPMAMLVFLFLIMISLSIRSRAGAIRLAEASKYTKLLEQQSRMRMQFFENMSHEIRTPLTIISGYTQRAIRRLKAGAADEQTIQELTHAYYEINRLTMLVEQDFFVTEVGYLPEISKIDVTQFLEHCEGICAPILAKNQNRLLLEKPGHCPALSGNEAMLLQVIVNLCTNSNRHTQNDSLLLHLVYEENMAVFTLEDHGEGIDAKLLPHLVERGRSGDGRTGLGLSICKEIVESMKGEFKIESVRGEGTRIELSIPVYGGEKDETGNTIG